LYKIIVIVTSCYIVCYSVCYLLDSVHSAADWAHILPTDLTLTDWLWVAHRLSILTDYNHVTDRTCRSSLRSRERYRDHTHLACLLQPSAAGQTDACLHRWTPASGAERWRRRTCVYLEDSGPLCVRISSKHPRICVDRST